MKILYPDSSGYPDIRILCPDIRILYPKLVCFGYHFLENFPFVEKHFKSAQYINGFDVDLTLRIIRGVDFLIFTL